jgi:hypothetical protein
MKGVAESQPNHWFFLLEVLSLQPCGITLASNALCKLPICLMSTPRRITKCVFHGQLVRRIDGQL